MSHKKKLFIVQIIALGFLSLSVFIMPILGRIWLKTGSGLWLILNGILFWGSFFILLGSALRFGQLRKRSHFTTEKAAGCNQLGLIHFCQNPGAKLADTVMCLSLGGLIIVSIWAQGMQILVFFLLSVFIFSFGMHCLLNGAGYLYVKDSGAKSYNRQ